MRNLRLSRRRGFALALLALLLAGCLEEPAPREEPAPGVGGAPGGGLPPVTTPPVLALPEPPAGAVLLYEREHVFGPAVPLREDAVAIGADVTQLVLLGTMSAPLEAPDATVRLRAPGGTVVAECTWGVACSHRVAGPAPGAWSVVYSEAGGAQNASVRLFALVREKAPTPPTGDVPPTATTPPPIPTPTPTPPPQPVPAGPDNVYAKRFAFDGGRANRSDRFTVLPGHAWLNGSITMNAAAASDAGGFVPRARLITPVGYTIVVDCAAGACPVNVDRPMAGRWLVTYEGQGTGEAYVNLTLVPPPGASPLERPTPLVAYSGTHAYFSHVNRAAFGEGLTVPAGYSSLRFRVEDTHSDVPADAATTAVVELRGPPGSDVVLSCPLPIRGEPCVRDVADPPRGMWEVVYQGSDARAHVKVDVTLARS